MLSSQQHARAALHYPLITLENVSAGARPILHVLSMDLDRARGLPGLRSAWRSDLSPRANRIINHPLLNDIDIDNVRIDVYDVSAQLVDIPLTEPVDVPIVRASSHTSVNVHSHDAESLSSGALPRVAAGSFPALEESHGHDRELDSTGANLLESASDMHHEVLGTANGQLPPVRSANDVQLSGAPRHVASNGLGQSQPRPRGPSPRRSSSVDRSVIRREGSPARASSNPRSLLNAESRTSHDSHLGSSGPAYRSKTPPRLHLPFAGGVEKPPLSPTQSLPVQNGFYHGHSSRVHGSNGDAHPRKEHVIEVPAFGNHNIRSNGVREDDGRPHISNGYVSENGQVRFSSWFTNI